MLSSLLLIGLGGLLSAPLDLPKIVLGTIVVAAAVSVFAITFVEGAISCGLYIAAGVTIYQLGYFTGFVIRARYLLPRSSPNKAAGQLSAHF